MKVLARLCLSLQFELLPVFFSMLFILICVRRSNLLELIREMTCGRHFRACKKRLNFAILCPWLAREKNNNDN